MVGREGIEPPQSKTADLQSAELTTCSTYPLSVPGDAAASWCTRHAMIRAGADDGTRTRNRRFTKPLLYQLSYVGARRTIPQVTLWRPRMIGPSGPERQPRPGSAGPRIGRPGGPRRAGRVRISLGPGLVAAHDAGSGPPGSRSRAVVRSGRRRPASGAVDSCVSAARGRAAASPPRFLASEPPVGSLRRGRPVRSAVAARRPPARRVTGSSAATGSSGDGGRWFAALGGRLVEQDRAGDRRVERADGAAHRDPDEQVAAPADGRTETLALAADDERQRPAQVGLADRQRRVGVGADDPQPADVEVGQRRGEVVDRGEQQVLDRARRGLDRRRAERRLAPGREDDAVDRRRLGAPQQRPDVLGVLERVEDEDERRLVALDGPGGDVVDLGVAAGRHHERDALVAVEPGQRGERAALDLDDRDPQVRRRGGRASRGPAGAAARRAAGAPRGERRTPPRPAGGRRRARPPRDPRDRSAGSERTVEERPAGAGPVGVGRGRSAAADPAAGTRVVPGRRVRRPEDPCDLGDGWYGGRGPPGGGPWRSGSPGRPGRLGPRGQPRSGPG